MFRCGHCSAARRRQVVLGHRPEQIDLRRHIDYVMERVMSRGGWVAMRWLRETYPPEAMSDFLRRKGARLAPRELAYWSLIAGLEIALPRGGARPPWAGP
jgi:squalene cyclase